MKRTLILNVAYQPLTIINVRRGLLLSFKDNGMRVLSYYEDSIWSETKSFALPAVMVYPKFINPHKNRIPTKRTILSRDNYQCQYCNIDLNRSDATIDHVTPVSKFLNKKEANTWENMVACCKPCNYNKGDKSIAKCGMFLTRKPREPSSLLNIHNPPKEWMEYVSS
jgi:uncharacterized protein (TIGR02646 family)